MVRTTTHTGGNFEFGDTGELGDTESTAKFKELYNDYMSKPKWKRFFIRLFKK